MRAALLIAAGALVACSSPDRCAAGDPAQPLEMRVVVFGADVAPAVIGDGARVALMKPPQGGRVIYAGAEVRGGDICNPVNLVGALRDPTTHAVFGLEGRPVLLAARSDGWAAADEVQPSNYANIAVCPNQRSSRDIDEEPYELYVKLTDGVGRSAEGVVDVVPFCAEPDTFDECTCICKTGYVLGQSCGAPDGGM